MWEYGGADWFKLFRGEMSGRRFEGTGWISCRIYYSECVSGISERKKHLFKFPDEKVREEDQKGLSERTWTRCGSVEARTGSSYFGRDVWKFNLTSGRRQQTCFFRKYLAKMKPQPANIDLIRTNDR